MSPTTGPRVSPTGDLPERSRRLLARLVREYIEHGEAVSSRWLADKAGMGLSSATVRSILSQLETEGYLHQPHTSAGRVPTDRGYRCYVDLMLQGRRATRSLPEVEARLRQAGSVEDVLANVSHEVSRASHHLGLAFVPADETTALRHIELVTLDGSRSLIVLVATTGQVWHKVVSLGETISPEELTQAANYLNAHFAGERLATIRDTIAVSLAQDRAIYDKLMARALRLASAGLEGLAPQTQLWVYGASSLLDGSEPATGITLATLRAVLLMIEEKHRLIRLLAEYVEGPGLTIVIGAEHSNPELRDFSLVASTEMAAGRTATIGVIGPRRMKYARAISAVESASGAVGRVLADPRN